MHQMSQKHTSFGRLPELNPTTYHDRYVITLNPAKNEHKLKTAINQETLLSLISSTKSNAI
jgi:hypothetical protein